MKFGKEQNFTNLIGGQAVPSQGNEEHLLYSPINRTVLGTCRYSVAQDVQHAVEVAQKAQKSWGQLTTKKRVEVHYEYRTLLKSHRDEMAEICHLENGKTIAEACAGVDKAIELTEFACSMPQMISGKVQEVSTGIECKTMRVPIGVVASITPFNFPIMVPHWTVPNALATGNAIIVKPSELTPLSALMSAKLWKQAGLPDGLLSIIIGARSSVEAICDNKHISAITFVGSTAVAETVYKRASQNLKRVMTYGGSKNYMLLTQDAHPNSSNDIISAFCGMCGQRCMAASVLVAIGNVETQIEQIVEKSAALAPGTDIGAMITPQSIEKVHAYLDRAKSLGAKILLDGRAAKIAESSEDFAGGYYLGASVIDWRGLEDAMPLEEIFGPTLEILGARTLDEALSYQKASPYGNGAAIFTQNGRTAQEATKKLQAGMIGVNIGIPVPREPFSFGGIKSSRFGQGGITGSPTVDFFTNEIKITTKWNPEDKKDWMS